MDREPVVIIGAIVALVNAILGMVVAFGWQVSDVQQASIGVVVTAVTTLAGIVFTRNRVSPVKALPPPLPPAQ